jgi:hypothetical protein
MIASLSKATGSGMSRAGRASEPHVLADRVVAREPSPDLAEGLHRVEQDTVALDG